MSFISTFFAGMADSIRPVRHLSTARLWEIDLLRGIAIIMMVIYHLMWDLRGLGGYDINVNSGFWHYLAASHRQHLYRRGGNLPDAELQPGPKSEREGQPVVQVFAARFRSFVLGDRRRHRHLPLPAQPLCALRHPAPDRRLDHAGLSLPALALAQSDFGDSVCCWRKSSRFLDSTIPG